MRRRQKQLVMIKSSSIGRCIFVYFFLGGEGVYVEGKNKKG